MAHSYQPFVGLNSKLTHFCLLMLVMVLSCKKVETEKGVTPLQLLTGSKWQLVSTGFDDNKNGRIDAGEELIRDCDKDNTLHFRIDGSGQFSDNGLVCGGPSENAFNWQLNGDSVISIQGNIIKIVKLTELEFIYAPKIEGLVVDYIISYRH